jgi:hypothetical protein|nr:glycosyl transferase [Bacillota bacterium]
MRTAVKTSRPLPVKLIHLRRLTDDTGIIEHGIGKIPRRKEGYSTDDNARALWTCVEWGKIARRTGDAEAAEQLARLSDTYLAYLVWVQKEDGHFHNNVAYNRRWEEEEPSDDCLGRTLWSTATAAVWDPDGDRSRIAQHLCQSGFRAVDRLRYPRGFAFSLSAACLLLREAEANPRLEPLFRNWILRDLPATAERLGKELIQRFRKHSGPGWRWFEDVMTYSNGVFPWALFQWHRTFPSREAEQTARESLDFLIEKMTSPEGFIRPVGNRGWCTRQGGSQWDQQPVEVMKLAMACEQGYAVTGDAGYRDVLKKCRAWFHGDNDLRVPMADPADGSCCDGLTENGPNRNRGAESTLAYLLTEAIYHKMREGMRDDETS